MLGFFGIDCTHCPVSRVTMDNNDILKIETAEKWSKEFGFILQKSDMNFFVYRSKVLFDLYLGSPFTSCSLGKDDCGQCPKYP